TSEAEVRDRVRGLVTGADEYVGKPYDRAQLTERTRQLIHRRRMSAGGRAQATVLVIDDSPTYREQLRETLERAGYAVLLAPSGEEGLRLASAHCPDLLIVDNVLPGIGGAKVISRVRSDQTLGQTPCLLLTASMDPKSELVALEAGADAYLQKG